MFMGAVALAAVQHIASTLRTVRKKKQLNLASSYTHATTLLTARAPRERHDAASFKGVGP